MIYYFSGTGNTAYCARHISTMLDEKLCFIPDEKAADQIFTGESLGFMFPVYAWGVPPFILDFIESLSDSFVNDIRTKQIPVWMVCTCGDETGRAPEMLENALSDRGIVLSGKWSVLMPDCYVLLPGFDVDSEKEERQKLEAAPARLKDIAVKIKERNWETDILYGPMPTIKTRLIYPFFKKWGIIRRKWHWMPDCIQCGKCRRVCPMGNIEMRGGHPRWGNKCVSCLACYHNCPVHAVAYGHRTQHKGQYICPLK